MMREDDNPMERASPQFFGATVLERREPLGDAGLCDGHRLAGNQRREAGEGIAACESSADVGREAVAELLGRFHERFERVPRCEALRDASPETATPPAPAL